MGGRLEWTRTEDGLRPLMNRVCAGIVLKVLSRLKTFACCSVGKNCSSASSQTIVKALNFHPVQHRKSCFVLLFGLRMFSLELGVGAVANKQKSVKGLPVRILEQEPHEKQRMNLPERQPKVKCLQLKE